MAPKKKGGKKGKQQDDWDSDKDVKPTVAASVGGSKSDDDSEDEVPLPAKKGASKFSFAGLDDADGNPVQPDDDDDDDEGGLMGLMAKSSSSKKSKKDKKKKKKGGYAGSDDEDVQPEQDPAEDDYADKKPVQMTAEELMEEEYGPTKTNKKGGKKAKKGGKKQQADDDFDEDAFLAAEAEKMRLKAEEDKKAAAPAPAPAVAEEKPAKEEDEDEQDDGAPAGGGVLSKKEKEKLKKEKEKAKKKAQAAAKKAAAGGDAAPAPEPAAEPAPAAEDAADDGEEGGAAGSSKNKKKKKKTGAKEEAPAAPAAAAAASKKKVPAHIAAMQAALEKKKAAEEEARRREEEERRKVEEEEARLAEIERKKEEEKQRKKDKEKAKKDQLKREGKYMTPKQKADAAAAKLRREAMLASGQIKVEGLEEAGDDDAASVPRAKKPVYGKKKPQKKGPTAPATTSPAPEAPAVETTAEDPTREPEHEPGMNGAVPYTTTAEGKPADEEDKDDWDAESDKEPAVAAAEPEEELDDWDASSSSEDEKSEEKPKAAPVPASAPAKPADTKKANGAEKSAATPAKASPAAKAQPAKSSAAPAAKAATPSKAAPAKAAPVNGKAKAGAKPAESESEEEEDEEDDDDDDEDGDSDDESDDDSDDSDESESDEERISSNKRAAAERKAQAAARRLQKREEAVAAGSKDNLRSPICCILGHVDTGKTKLLDKIRQTNVQEGEAGGITQQIGATYFPMDIIRTKTAVMKDNQVQEAKLPGLLVIDTPGHESFTNLRTRGSSLCNIAILVVDIMHGLEPQTLESIRLLRNGKTPFIVALNKIDRLYNWQATPDGAFRESLAKQEKAVQNEFDRRLKEAQLAFAEQGLNAIPYYENTNFAKNVSLVPTSAHTGEGVPDMLNLLIKLTQERMSAQLMYISELECTLLEVKVIEGLGTTIDVVLSNGILREGDTIVVCGLNGPIVTQVRALLTPQPLKEMRVKGSYVHHKEVKASLGIKIVAPDLEKAIAGSRLLVLGEDDDIEDLKEEVMTDLQSLVQSVDRSGRGVYVQASTLGALEALLEFLRTSKIPVAGINIGPVHKKDITRAAVMLERAPELAVVLAFDVEIDKDAAAMADQLGIKVFKADIIYHLFDAFTKHNADVLEAKRKDAAPSAVWPVRLKILRCFAKRDPIIVGCDIIEGQLRVGTPVCVVKTDPETKKKDIIKLGRVTGCEINHKSFDIVKRSQVGAGVAVKIEHAVYESAKLFGRHFDEKDEIISFITRESIDTLKAHFKADVAKDEWQLIIKQKAILGIA